MRFIESNYNFYYYPIILIGFSVNQFFLRYGKYSDNYVIRLTDNLSYQNNFTIILAKMAFSMAFLGKIVKK